MPGSYGAGLAISGPPVSTAAVLNTWLSDISEREVEGMMDAVKLNGTIHADEQGTYMMCGAKRVPVVVEDANGQVWNGLDSVWASPADGDDTGDGLADGPGDDEK